MTGMAADDALRSAHSIFNGHFMPALPSPSGRIARRRPRLRQRGAALLLLLAVVGVGAATVLVSALGGNRNDLARERKTLVQLSEANEALIGFALTHGRLPRPAVSPTDGRERALPCDSEPACTGFLPWVALGIDGTDAWGKLLRYSVTPAYTQAPLMVSEVVATKRVLSRNAAGTPYFVAGQAECTLGAQCVPAVVISSGRRRLGTSPFGIAIANDGAGNIDEQQNNAASNDFVRRTASDNPADAGGEFDDLLVWLPLRRLYLRMTAAGQLL